MPAAHESIRYTTSFDAVTSVMLVGFFEGWKNPVSPEEHLKILRGSDHCVLAMNTLSGRVVGFITAITDGRLSAFIPLLEVLPHARNRGIGTQLVQRMLELLAHYPCVDLVCDAELEPFYKRHGLTRSTAMILRRPSAPGTL